MKKILLSTLMCLVASLASAQVVFDKFRLKKLTPYGVYTGFMTLETKFKVTSDIPLKYVYINWYAVNAVGDVISGVERGIRIEGLEFVKPKQMQNTGPFSKGTYKRYVDWAVRHSQGNETTAFPYQLLITYMGQEKADTITITKENIKQFFPKVEWMEINRYNPAL